METERGKFVYYLYFVRIILPMEAMEIVMTIQRRILMTKM